MTRQDILKCAHEPFGDAFYYGPERLGERYEDDEEGRLSSGFSKTTYKDVIDRLDRDASEVRIPALAFCSVVLYIHFSICPAIYPHVLAAPQAGLCPLHGFALSSCFFLISRLLDSDILFCCSYYFSKATHDPK